MKGALLSIERGRAFEIVARLERRGESLDEVGWLCAAVESVGEAQVEDHVAVREFAHDRHGAADDRLALPVAGAADRVVAGREDEVQREARWLINGNPATVQRARRGVTAAG